MSETWFTKISKVKPNEIRLRGYRIDELMGRVTFSQGIYLALKGELPSPEIARLLDAIFVSSIDHGVTPPSALATRTATSTGAPINAAVAAGILSINDFHGGAIYNCMGVITEGLHRISKQDVPVEEIGLEIVQEYLTSKKRMAGFGHRLHTADPRSARLFDLADEAGISGNGVALLKALQAGFRQAGKDLPINVDGAIAGILVDLEIPRDLANAFFIIPRVPGLVAQYYEERTTQRPMRYIDPTSGQYNGQEDRDLPERSGNNGII
jgi:citrate synthase